VTLEVTAASGDLSFWNLSNLRLQGRTPVSVTKSSDGRTLVAKFNNTNLQALPAGDAVSVSLTGDVERDGLVTPFTTMTTIRVIK
jgi:hypothetical protein